MKKALFLTVALVAGLGVSLTAGAQVAAPTSGYVQFDDLTVSSVSSFTAPAMILAVNDAAASTTAGQMISDSQWGTCEQFATQDSPSGMSVLCPAQTLVANPTSTATSSTYVPYQLEVGASTQLLMSDRSDAVLANFTPGDIINVFGFYTGDGTIEASIIRDLSKPTGGSQTVQPASAAALEVEIAQLQEMITELQAIISGSTTTTAVSAPMIMVTPTTPAPAPTTPAPVVTPAPIPTAPTY